ncbi:MAG: ATP-binding protein [Candidatus Riflebacteria bacterium]|jgi:predicted AAA+ superfamily ATPase|nr:ATP-binding protein [Candidatus Riflebacteria bacterium]
MVTKMINRDNYLDWLKSWKDKQIIKVISGVRRSGKSTLFEIYQNYLLQSGISHKQIISINFEDIDFEELTDYKKLHSFIKSKLNKNKMNYIFLDEIQNVMHYEKAVDSLFLNKNCDIYITGSNAYFMSGELATLLSGRYIELKILPLSFKEFYSALPKNHKNKTDIEKFNLYLQSSSFPFAMNLIDKKREISEYLRDIYNTIILKDVVNRLKISDITTLENITKFLLSNIGSRVSTKKVSDTLISQNKPSNQKTIDKYVKGLVDSLLFYEVSRFNIKGRQFLTTQNKYYAVDTSLRNLFVKTYSTDTGHILENIVYLELIRRGYQVYIGQFNEMEIDFVAIDSQQQISYYQVSASTLDENTLQRELLPFKQIKDNYPKYLLTLDEIFGTANYNGILKKNIINWLLE